MTSENAIWKLIEMLEVQFRNVTDSLDAINSNVETIKDNLSLIQETLSNTSRRDRGSE